MYGKQPTGVRAVFVLEECTAHRKVKAEKEKCEV
jgi:hypothetical protein